MQLIVLGRYSPFPPPGGACPGYLLQHGDASLLVDCGSGVVARLQNHVSFDGLDYVILSHLHGDHSSDMNVLRYAADTDLRGRQAPAAMKVYAPPMPSEEFTRLSYKEAVKAHPITEDDILQLGPFEVCFARTDHPLLCYAVRVTAGGRTLAYTADTAYSPGVVEIAEGADLLLAEASLEESQRGFRGHMTASQASVMAKKAGVGRLLLTHFWPYHDVQKMVDSARAASDIPVEAAEEENAYLV